MRLIPLSILLTVLIGLRTYGQADQSHLNVLKAHPRILLLKGEELKLREKLSNDATYNFLHKIIVKECDALLSTPTVERVFSGRRLLTVSRECRRRIFFLSYAFRMTGEEKYLKRAERELLAAAKFVDWNPSHFLDAAEMTMGVAIGYDWLYAALSPSTRGILEEAILHKGVEPSLKPENSTWLTASHNWNQVCNASMAYGALALLDKYPQLSKKILLRSVTSVRLAMDEYNPDGVYPEGYGYWAYGTSFNVLLISALEKAFDHDFGLGAHHGFLKTPYYLLHMTGSSGLPFNYSDCDTKALLNPAMGWFAARLNDPSIMTFEMELIKGNKNLHRIRELPALMVWSASIDLTNIPTPESCLWVGQGRNPVALLRSSWEPKKGIYVGLKAGSPAVTHSHMDVGSFVMDASGERWAMDFGFLDYSGVESKGLKIWTLKQQSDRWKVFRISNFSHNTLTINKALQNVEGSAAIIASTDGPMFRSAITDLSSLYSSEARKVVRGVAIVQDQYVVIRDEVELDKPGEIRWNMVTDAQISIADNKTAILSKNGKKLLLRIAEPADAVLTTWSTDPPEAFDEPNPGSAMIGFEIRRKSGETTPLMVYLVPEGGSLENKMAIPALSEWPSFNQLK